MREYLNNRTFTTILPSLSHIRPSSIPPQVDYDLVLNFYVHDIIKFAYIYLFLASLEKSYELPDGQVRKITYS